MAIRKFSDLEKALKKAVKKTMENEVARATKVAMHNNVQDVVYDAGEPIEYERRNFTNGSLGDPSTMKHEYKNDILEVTNEADFNHAFAIHSDTWEYGDVDLDRSLAYNIEYGYGAEDEWWNEPRPFIEKTREDMRNGGFKKALKEGLEKNGLKIK